MENHSQPRCTLLHVYAQDNEGSKAQRWARIRAKYPIIKPVHINSYLADHPDLANGRFTDIESNATAWPSYTQYMIAVGQDDDAARISKMLNEDKIRIADIREISGLEAREYDREINLFKWHRPVQRVATIVEIASINFKDVLACVSEVFEGHVEVRTTGPTYVAIVPPFVQAAEARIFSLLDQI